MIWTAPIPRHRIRLAVWRLFHWRRVRHFRNRLRLKMLEREKEFAAAFSAEVWGRP